jgi:RNA polymerase sigma-70 factor (ECF subfamily)
MQIISRSQKGDPDAFAALFEQYKNLVYKTAFLILNNADDADDILQDVFVLVYKSLATFDPHKGAFTTWLYRITIRCCLNFRRKRRVTSLPLYEDLLAEPIRDDDIEVIRQAIEGLSKKQRAVIILRYYWDLPYHEIAQALDIPLGTVKSRINLALKTLRQTLEPQGVDWQEVD